MAVNPAGFGPGDPEYDAMVEEERRRRLAMTHAPPPAAPVAAVPPRPAALLDMERDPATLGMSREPPLEEEPPPAPAPAPFRAPLIGPDVQSSTRSETKTSRQVATEAEKEARERLGQTFEGQEQSIRAATDIKARQADTSAQLAEQHLAERDQIRQAAEEGRRQKQEASRLAAEELAKQRESRKGMKLTDYWEEKSTGARVTAALLVGLGQFGAGLAGRPESGAMKIIDDAVARHRQQQLDAMANQDKVVEGAEKTYEQRRMESQAHEVEVANSVRDLYEQMELRRAKALATYGRGAAEAEGDGMIQELRQRRALADVEAEKSLRTLIEQNVGRTTTVDNSRQNAALAAGEPEVKDRGVKGPGGQTFFNARNEKEAAQGSEAIKTYRQFRDILDDLQGSFEKRGSTEFLDRKELARRQALTRQAQMLIKRLDSLGALDKGSVEFMEGMMPQTGLFTTDAAAFESIRALRSRAEDDLVTTVDSLGGKGLDVIRQVNKTEPGRASFFTESEGWQPMRDEKGQVVARAKKHRNGGVVLEETVPGGIQRIKRQAP